MNLAVVLQMQKKYPEAEAEYRKSLEVEEAKLGENNRDTLETSYNLALTLWEHNKYADARPLAKRAAENSRKLLGPTHPDVQRYEKLAARLAESP
jgi:hypothetical protein